MRSDVTPRKGFCGTPSHFGGVWKSPILHEDGILYVDVSCRRSAGINSSEVEDNVQNLCDCVTKVILKKEGHDQRTIADAAPYDLGPQQQSSLSPPSSADYGENSQARQEKMCFVAKNDKAKRFMLLVHLLTELETLISVALGCPLETFSSSTDTNVLM